MPRINWSLVLLAGILAIVAWNPIVAPSLNWLSRVGTAAWNAAWNTTPEVVVTVVIEPTPAPRATDMPAPEPTSAPRATDMPAPEPTSAPVITDNGDGPIFGTNVAKAMTDSEMYAVMQANGLPKGVKLVATNAPWEPAKWSWQSNDKAYTSFTLTHGWQATVAYPDGTIKVYVGTPEGVPIMNAAGFTLRQLDAYDLDSRIRASEQSLLEFENEFGQAPERGSDTYFTCNGNLKAEYTSTKWANACAGK